MFVFNDTAIDTKLIAFVQTVKGRKIGDFYEVLINQKGVEQYQIIEVPDTEVQWKLFETLIYLRENSHKDNHQRLEKKKSRELEEFCYLRARQKEATE